MPPLAALELLNRTFSLLDAVADHFPSVLKVETVGEVLLTPFIPLLFYLFICAIFWTIFPRPKYHLRGFFHFAFATTKDTSTFS